MKNNEVVRLKKHLLENGRDKSYNELAQQFGITDKGGESGEDLK